MHVSRDGHGHTQGNTSAAGCVAGALDFPSQAAPCDSVGEGRPKQGTRGGSDNVRCPERVS